MNIVIDLLLLLVLFIALGGAADFTVKNIKYIGAVFKIRLFVFGIVLGLVTTLPELSLGINATIDNAAVLSVGNLLGGIIVIIGLILGVGLIINHNTPTDGRLSFVIPVSIVIFSSVLLGFDGQYSFIDGLILIFLYIALILYLYRLNHLRHHSHIEIENVDKVTKAVFMAVLGVICVLIASHWIVKITLDLLNYAQISQLIIGLIVFSIGTNLPEISIAITSLRKKSQELSLSHLLSSAFTNVLVLGVLALFRPIIFEVNRNYWITAIFIFLILVLFGIFYYSGKNISRREGIILFIIYLIFIIFSLFSGLQK
jgi:cation:H+ antiporter